MSRLKDVNECRIAGLPFAPRGEVLDAADFDRMMGRAPVDDAPIPDPDEGLDWSLLLQRTAKGEIRKSLGNLTVILQHDSRWRHLLALDERAGEVQLLEEPPYAKAAGLPATAYPRAVADSDEVWLARWLEMTYGLDWPVEKIHQAADAVASRHAFDPVRDHLDGLKWDGTERLDEWIPRYLGAEDTALHRAIGACWLISAVARCYRPGCQADHVPVLEGAQGAGKSSAIRILAGDPSWFCDRLPDVRRGKDAAEILQGPWIVEVAELDAMGKADAAAIKAFFTSPSDRYRPPYARRSITRPRRCVFVATTNERTYLRDSTGGRRFWPVAVATEHGIDLPGLRAVRDQLLAEARERFEAGEAWHLTDPDLVAEVARAQEDRYQADEWESVAREYLDLTLAKQPDPRVTVGEVLKSAGLPESQWSRRDQMRMSEVLARLGWERVRRRDDAGRPRWVYVPIPERRTDPNLTGERSGSGRDHGGSRGGLGSAHHPNGDHDPNLGEFDDPVGITLGSASSPTETGARSNDPNDPNLHRGVGEVGDRSPDSGAGGERSGSLGSEWDDDDEVPW